jgi:hypothetical protein
MYLKSFITWNCVAEELLPVLEGPGDNVSGELPNVLEDPGTVYLKKFSLSWRILRIIYLKNFFLS